MRFNFCSTGSLQAKNPDAPKWIVDCEMYRSMREDKIVHHVRQLAERVRISGRPLQLEPMNSYERRIVHEAFKDDPEVGDLEPIGFGADQADHAAPTAGEERIGTDRKGLSANQNLRVSALCHPWIGSTACLGGGLGGSQGVGATWVCATAANPDAVFPRAF